MKAGFALLALLLASLFLITMGTLAQSARAQDGSLSPAGKLFIKDADSVDMMEVQLGRVAHDRGHSQEVKDFGASMVLDHTKANDELNLIATQNNLKLPLQVEMKHTLMIARLAKLSGDEFDRQYLQTMVKNHLKSIARFKKAISKVTDHDLNAWTVAMLPVLQQHLQHAQELSQKLEHR